MIICIPDTFSWATGNSLRFLLPNMISCAVVGTSIDSSIGEPKADDYLRKSWLRTFCTVPSNLEHQSRRLRKVLRDGRTKVSEMVLPIWRRLRCRGNGEGEIECQRCNKKSRGTAVGFGIASRHFRFLKTKCLKYGKKLVCFA